ncbi:MAG: hypothetical protein AB7I27_00905 [Bacteriovoracaceae bacterium]
MKIFCILFFLPFIAEAKNVLKIATNNSTVIVKENVKKFRVDFTRDSKLISRDISENYLKSIEDRLVKIQLMLPKKKCLTSAISIDLSRLGDQFVICQEDQKNVHEVKGLMNLLAKDFHLIKK